MHFTLAVAFFSFLHSFENINEKVMKKKRDPGPEENINLGANNKPSLF